MKYDVRLPGFGGAGVFLGRSIAGEPARRPGVDLWLVGPGFRHGLFGREVGPGFWASLARYLFEVAGAAFPENDVAAFLDPPSGLSIDVGTSDSARVGLRVLVIGNADEDPAAPDLDFESSRAAVANAAAGIQSTLGGLDLADFEELGR